MLVASDSMVYWDFAFSLAAVSSTGGAVSSFLAFGAPFPPVFYSNAPAGASRPDNWLLFLMAAAYMGSLTDFVPDADFSTAFE